MSSDELTLVRRMQARESAAMGELYDRFGATVYRLALRMVRNKAAAEDVTQETFLSIWNGIGNFDPARGTLACWVGTVARSRTIDYLRTAEFRAACRKASLNEVKRTSVPEAVPARLLLEAPWKKLKRQERLVLRLAHWSGLSQVEIAERLNRPLGTVKSWMRSGHRSLRAALEG